MLTPAEIEVSAEKIGQAKANLALPKAFVLGCMAGFYIGLGATFMLIVKADSTLSFGISSVLGGLAFSLGLFLVLVAGAELFTGNSLMAIGMLSKKYTLKNMLSRWVVVYAGNLVGSLLLALILHLAAFRTLGGGAVGEVAVSIAAAKAGLAPGAVFFRGILCNILVCLAVWMSFAGTTVADKFFAAAVPVAGFVACGFEHCIANMFFIPFGMLTQGAIGLDSVTMAGMVQNIILATAGNIMGGALMVACAYWFVYGKKAKR